MTDSLWNVFFTAFGGASVAFVALGYLLKQIVGHRLKKDLEEHKAFVKERESVTAVVNKYSRAILLAAEDAQDRLWHLCEGQGNSDDKVLLKDDELTPAYPSWPMTKQHYLQSTMYLICRYLCWVDILKSEVRFLAFNDDKSTAIFNYHLKRIERMLAETSFQKKSQHKIAMDMPLFQIMQMELGELLRKQDLVEPGQQDCMGFVQFKSGYKDLLEQSDAFQRLEDLLLGSMDGDEKNFCMTRLRLVANALLDLIEFLYSHNGLTLSRDVRKLSLSDFDLAALWDDWPEQPGDDQLI